MTTDSVPELKANLRRTIRAKRKTGFDCGEAHSMSLIELVVRNDFKTISAYEEFDNEPSLAGLREWCELNGVAVLLPEIVSETELTWRSDGEPADIKAAELIVMPALAAGRDGNRLGRGKGFYDRAVSSLDAPRVVVVHDTEVFNHVPAEGFDQKVSMVISCSEMIDLDGRLN
jgi:5-formyltetrahydrofolate cyclo-ligase